MPTLDDLATYLMAVTPTLGDIYVGFIPDTPNKLIALNLYSGTGSQFGFGTAGLRYEEPGLQVFARGEPEDEDEPYARIYRAYTELSKIQARTLPPSNTKYLMLRPRQAPYRLRQDEKSHRFEFVVNFGVWKEISLS